MINSLKNVLIGTISGLMFIVFYIMFHTSLLVSAAIAISLFAAFSPLVSTKKLYQVNITDMDRSSLDYFKKTIEEAENKIKEIKKLMWKIEKCSIRDRIQEICIMSDSIFDLLYNNPKDLSHMRRFLNYYLDSLVNIVMKYAALSEQSLDPEAYREGTEKIELFLAKTIIEFTNQLHKLQRKKIEALNTELFLFEASVQSEKSMYEE